MATIPMACRRGREAAGMRDRGVVTLRFAITVLLLCGGTAVTAQARESSVHDDLRPAYATTTAVAEGKRVADGLCAKCHGAAGISTARGVPHLAGQRPAYLYAKIKV